MLIKKIFFSILLIIIGWVFANLYRNMKEGKKIPEVGVIAVKKERLREKVLLTAKVSEQEIINITSSANSIVERIYPKVGDFVEKGEVLIELRQEELLTSLKREEFNLDVEKRKEKKLENLQAHPDLLEKEEEITKAKWELEGAKNELYDTKELYAKKAVSKRELEEKEEEIKRKELELNKTLRERDELLERLIQEKEETEINIPSITLKINELKNQIKGCIIKSPISGVIKKISVEKNSKVEIGSLLVSIATKEDLVAKATLKEENFFLIKPKQKVRLYSETLGKHYQGYVLKIVSSQAKKEKDEVKDGGWEVICSIENPSDLIPGMELSTEIIVKEKEEYSLTIPPEALYEEDSVMVIENGRIKNRKIEIGESTTDSVEVLSGLSEGEKVVVLYEEELKEGMRVKVKEIR